jgi:tetratricopeptide (TPR) repeat protein
MIHPLQWLLAVGITCIATLCTRADDVGDYLEQHGLKRLLAVHLEQQLERATGDEREQLLQQLMAVYTDLLETASDPASEATLKERSRRVLDQARAAGGGGAEELRLALLRATYRAAEKVAEDHRLRLASPADVESARQKFADLVGQFVELRQQIKQNVDLADRRLARAAGAEALAQAEALEKVRNVLAQCSFVTAWARYYDAWLGGHRDSARAAEPLFGELLVPDNPNPRPEDVSVDLRSSEAVARAILGMALTKSLTSSSATALSWIELLEHPTTFQPLRILAPAWKINVLLEHHEYDDVRQTLEEHRAGGGEVPAAWLRLVAVHVLEDAKRPRNADELVRFAVTQLAAMGELQQVLDIATRYGTDALGGGSGFAFQYVQGVMKYQQARQAHDSDTPTLASDVSGIYDEALSILRLAAAQPDADKYPAAAAGCKRLIAWCLYFQARFLDAAEAFENAAAGAPGKDAAEALWMAIVSLEKVVDAQRSNQSAQPGNVEVQLTGLIDRFLRQFPANERAAALQLRRAVMTQRVSEQAVAELLAISPTSEVYAAAQSRAADMLYQLFREGPPERRLSNGGTFLNIAMPQIGGASFGRDWSSPSTSQPLITRCRQVLEVSLTEGIDRLGAARTALEALDEAAAAGVDLAALADEIDCRRVQERLASDDPRGAAVVADHLWSRAHDAKSSTVPIWVRIATRAMFKYGYQQSRRADAPLEQRTAALELIVRYGGRVLREFQASIESAHDQQSSLTRDPLDEPGAMGYHVAVAEASMALWEQSGEAERGRAALFLFERLLTKRPQSASFLYSAAVLAERLGDQDKALDWWRRLAAGTPADTERWYEAKFHLIQILANTDPKRARQVMNQHKQLHPEYGPDPWGARLKGLDMQIPQE